MPNGFSTLIILIVGTILLAVIGGGYYFHQRNLSLSVAKPTSSPVASVPTLTPKPSTSDKPTSTPKSSSLPPQALTFAQDIQPSCTSASCGDTTTLEIYGSGFTKSTQLSATGQTNGNPYSGSLTTVSDDGQVVSFDIHSLPCQAYSATLTNPYGNAVNFSFYPSKCN